MQQIYKVFTYTFDGTDVSISSQYNNGKSKVNNKTIIFIIAAASYRGCGENEEPDHYAARIAFTGNSRVLGPVCIVAGALMTIAG